MVQIPKHGFMDLPDGTERIDSKEGCQQGDVMSMFFYALTIHPFLTKLRDILGQEGFNKCFADNLAVHNIHLLKK